MSNLKSPAILTHPHCCIPIKNGLQNDIFTISQFNYAHILHMSGPYYYTWKAQAKAGVPVKVDDPFLQRKGPVKMSNIRVNSNV